MIIIKNKIKSLERMFDNCDKLIDINELKYLNTKYCNNFSYMFYECSSLTDIKSLEKWNVSNCKNFKVCFMDVYH